jgi:F-type H+-transporting ATPase subunit b
MFVTKALAATEEAAHGGSGAFPPFDSSSFASQIFWLAITFGIFYWLMSKMVIPRISSILEVRRDRISRDLDAAQRLKEDADAAEAAYEQELAEARKSAHDIAREARDEAKAKADAERSKVEAELDEKIAESEKQIAEIKKKALAQVDTIASDTASAIVKELIGGSVTKAEIGKAISASSR